MGRTIVLLPRVDHHTSSDVYLPLRRVVLQLPQYLLLSGVPLHAADIGFAAHEVGVQLRLGDEEVQLALLTFCLRWGQATNTFFTNSKSPLAEIFIVFCKKTTE